MKNKTELSATTQKIKEINEQRDTVFVIPATLVY